MKQGGLPGPRSTLPVKVHLGPCEGTWGAASGKALGVKVSGPWRRFLY